MRSFLVIAALLTGSVVAVAFLLVPGTSYVGEIGPADDAEMSLATQLEEDVRMLTETIGERNVFNPEALDQAADFIERELKTLGFEPSRQTYRVQGVDVHNLEVEIRGSKQPGEIVVFGAHYDSVLGSPGANDNGSGVAALLSLARTFATKQPGRTLRFVFFVNEEPPFFTTPDMGSVVYARRSAERDESIRGMLSLETIGYYDDRPRSQDYPLSLLHWLYPDRGNFIGFVSNLRSGLLLREVVQAFRTDARVPSRAAALPGFVPGAGWSDHWAFWQEGYPAIMLTDTAPFRYPHYHTPQDTWDRLDYHRMALVVKGLEPVVATLARF